VNGFAPCPCISEKYFRGIFDSMKLSDTFDCTEGGADVASGPAVAVDAAEMDDEEADGARDEWNHCSHLELNPTLMSTMTI